MTFDLNELQDAVAQHGQVTRVVVAAVEGSAPREVGAFMLVWANGQSGTIGGGALEWEAAQKARQQTKPTQLDRIPLGPALGQCCGGAVTLLSETYDADSLAKINGSTYLRQVEVTQPAPITLQQAAKSARNANHQIEPQFANGWMLEPITAPTRHLWIFGAGHVGRALVNVFDPIPDFQVTWIDTATIRFPETTDSTNRLIAENPADVVKYAPDTAEHLILTYSHALDLELCHQVLSRTFTSCGLIGSATKWARFRNRLGQLGHSPAQIARICCPIGQPELGKHPQAIAVGVAAALMSTAGKRESVKDLAG